MKKVIKSLSLFVLGCFAVLAVVVFSSFMSSGQLGRYVVYNNADIQDYEIFPSRNLNSSTDKYVFESTEEGHYPRNVGIDGQKIPIETLMEATATVAFMIIKDDTIQYEKYFQGYEESSIIPSFSMAKSITSLLIGCAIDDGLIQSEDEAIINYIPELEKNDLGAVSIKHLLQMTSGIAFNESYTNPFGDAASIYYGNDLEKVIFEMESANAPGETFAYHSGNTQLLGMVLDRALNGKSLSTYLQEKIWAPLGMEYDASWSLDHEDGLEKTFCCINARTRDFAKIGRLILQKGNWDGTQIVSESWIDKAMANDVSEGSVEHYQYQWWIPGENTIMAEGILGQFIYINTEKNLIFVRLGEEESTSWVDLFNYFASAY